MDWETVISILKWVGLAFTAGLIGYFGKFLGQRIISRFSKNKDKAESKKTPPPQSSRPNEKPGYKLEKKRLKQEIKRKKKQEKAKI
jgi:hypothetical protein